MKIFDLYGINVVSLDEAKEAVEGVLKVSLNPHDSSYHCGAYYRLDLPDGGSIILQQNFDEYEDEWTEAGFREMPFLLYVSNHPSPDDVRESMNQEVLSSTFLKRDEV